MNERVFSPFAPRCRKLSVISGGLASGAGFTLVEVMLAMVVLGMSALAALAGMLFTYRASDANLRALAAWSNARAVAEQIQTLDADTLAKNSLPVDIPSSGVGSLIVNEWNERTDDLHATEGNPADDLALGLRPEVSQTASVTGFTCTQVVLHFRWTENSFFAPRLREDALTVVLSNIPTR